MLRADGLKVDLLIRNGVLLTGVRGEAPVRNGEILLRGGRIERIGPRLKAQGRPLQILDVQGALVTPGFVHGHLHACQTLFRNRADGLELLDWLRERIWPYEAAHDRASLRASADLTFAELIRSGATAALDMGTVHHTDAIFESARDCGFRLTGGKAMMDHGQGVPARLRETTEQSLAESARLIDAWHGKANGRLRYAYAPRFVLSCSEALLKEVARQAVARKVRIHSHASENASECDVVRERTGTDNVAYFHSLGLTGPHLTLAHCVWLTAQEHRILHDTKTVVCHCPSSNLKLASGVAKVPELLEEGVRVALGADGAPCNNNLDIFLEMRLAALLHKPRAGPSSMSPQQVFEMATLGGARALGLEEEIGTLEEGKRADLAVIELGASHASPGEDWVSRLVYSGKAADVRHVIIDGKWVLRDRRLLTLDEPEVVASAERHAARIARAVGGEL